MRYGQVLQLRHKKSGKFLTVAPRAVAQIEKDTLRCFLPTGAGAKPGSSYSWFTVLPRYRMRQRGDLVECNDQVILECSKRGDEFLHVADAATRDVDTVHPAACKEVNCSLLSSGWKVLLYSPHEPAVRSGEVLHAGRAVRLFHSQTASYLSAHVGGGGSATRAPSPVHGGGAGKDKDGDTGGSDGTKGVLRVCLQQRSEEADVGGDVLAGMRNDSNTLWTLECAQREHGGAALWQSSFRLRHFNTGKYLCSLPGAGASSEKAAALAADGAKIAEKLDGETAWDAPFRAKRRSQPVTLFAEQLFHAN